MYEEDRENREDRDQEIERTEIMDDVDALNMALQNGEIDMIAQLPAASASLFSDTDTYTIGAATSTRSQFLQFNLESEALKDVNIRKAISMCIDREGYADVVFAGYANVNALYGGFANIGSGLCLLPNLIALVVLAKPFFGLVKDWESGERKYDTAITDKNHHYIKMCKSYEEELARQEQSGK